MLDFLNQNSGALIVIFTGVVTLSTVVYAILTAVLVAETSKGEGSALEKGQIQGETMHVGSETTYFHLKAYW